jgi:conjugal transfer/entry exclusion protein
MREHSESNQINKIRNEKRDITTEIKKIQKIIRSYYKSLYTTKLENMDEVDNFLGRYQVPKLNQGHINRLNSPITHKEIEATIKVSQPKKSQDQMGLVQKSIRPSKKI